MNSNTLSVTVINNNHLDDLSLGPLRYLAEIKVSDRNTNLIISYHNPSIPGNKARRQSSALQKAAVAHLEGDNYTSDTKINSRTDQNTSLHGPVTDLHIKTYQVFVIPDLQYGLGLRLDTDSLGRTVIVSFKQHPITGAALAIEATGKVHVGDELFGVNNSVLQGLPLSECINKIRQVIQDRPDSPEISAEKVPITLHFSRPDCGKVDWADASACFHEAEGEHAASSSADQVVQKGGPGGSNADSNQGDVFRFSSDTGEDENDDDDDDSFFGNAAGGVDCDFKNVGTPPPSHGFGLSDSTASSEIHESSEAESVHGVTRSARNPFAGSLLTPPQPAATDYRVMRWIALASVSLSDDHTCNKVIAATVLALRSGYLIVALIEESITAKEGVVGGCRLVIIQVNLDLITLSDRLNSSSSSGINSSSVSSNDPARSLITDLVSNRCFVARLHGSLALRDTRGSDTPLFVQLWQHKADGSGGGQKKQKVSVTVTALLIPAPCAADDSPALLVESHSFFVTNRVPDAISNESHPPRSLPPSSSHFPSLGIQQWEHLRVDAFYATIDPRSQSSVARLRLNQASPRELVVRLLDEPFEPVALQGRALSDCIAASVSFSIDHSFSFLPSRSLETPEFLIVAPMPWGVKNQLVLEDSGEEATFEWAMDAQLVLCTDEDNSAESAAELEDDVSRVRQILHALHAPSSVNSPSWHPAILLSALFSSLSSDDGDGAIEVMLGHKSVLEVGLVALLSLGLKTEPIAVDSSPPITSSGISNLIDAKWYRILVETVKRLLEAIITGATNKLYLKILQGGYENTSLAAYAATFLQSFESFEYFSPLCRGLSQIAAQLLPIITTLTGLAGWDDDVGENWNSGDSERQRSGPKEADKELSRSPTTAMMGEAVRCLLEDLRTNFASKYDAWARNALLLVQLQQTGRALVANATRASSSSSSQASVSQSTDSGAGARGVHVSGVGALSLLLSRSQASVFSALIRQPLDAHFDSLRTAESDIMNMRASTDRKVSRNLLFFGELWRGRSEAGQAADGAEVDVLELLKQAHCELWIHDPSLLVPVIEDVALRQFAVHRDSMKIFLELVLAGRTDKLLQLAKTDRNVMGKQLVALLSTSFSTEKGRNVVRKNASALMRLQRYRHAVATFLCAEPPLLKEACSVIVRQLGDPSLALLVTRIVETRTESSPAAQVSGAARLGYGGLVLGTCSRNVISTYLLPRLLLAMDTGADASRPEAAESFGRSKSASGKMMADGEASGQSDVKSDVGAVMQAWLCGFWLQDRAIMNKLQKKTSELGFFFCGHIRVSEVVEAALPPHQSSLPLRSAGSGSTAGCRGFEEALERTLDAANACAALRLVRALSRRLSFTSTSASAADVTELVNKETRLAALYSFDRLLALSGVKQGMRVDVYAVLQRAECDAVDGGGDWSCSAYLEHCHAALEMWRRQRDVRTRLEADKMAAASDDRAGSAEPELAESASTSADNEDSIDQNENEDIKRALKALAALSSSSSTDTKTEEPAAIAAPFSGGGFNLARVSKSSFVMDSSMSDALDPTPARPSAVAEKPVTSSSSSSEIPNALDMFDVPPSRPARSKVNPSDPANAPTQPNALDMLDMPPRRIASRKP